MNIIIYFLLLRNKYKFSFYKTDVESNYTKVDDPNERRWLTGTRETPVVVLIVRVCLCAVRYINLL